MENGKKEGTPGKKSGASPASKKAKSNPNEEREVPSRSAVNPHHKDNSLKEFRRICDGIADLPGM